MTDSPAASSPIVAGRYRIERRIARGGMADVFLALDTVLDRPVALKVLADRQVDDPTHVARFEREARSAAGLSHPNIVAIYDSGVDGGRYYIAMEHVDGSTLAERLAERGALPVEDGCRIAAEVADALDFAHRHGTIHRDVKPSNILLGTDGRTRVTDFGIARALTGDEGLTEVGMVMGTPRYSSPEQAQGHPLDPRSDLYSLGVVLFEMLTGRPPFSGATPVAVAQLHVSEPPPRASTVRPELAGDADRVIDTLLAKDPDARYRTAADLRVDLQRLARGERVHGHGGGGRATAPPAAAPAAAAPAADAPTAAMTAAMAVAGDRTEAMPPWMHPDQEPDRVAAAPTGPAAPGQRFSLPFKVLVSVLVLTLLGLAAIVISSQVDLGGGAETADDAEEPTTSAAPAAPAADAGGAAGEESTPGSATVPSVTDELQADAERILGDAGFRVRVEPVDVDADSPTVGRVVAQRPAGGGEVEPGTEIVLEIGRAAQTATTSPTAASSTSTTSPPTSATTEAPATTTDETEPPTSGADGG